MKQLIYLWCLFVVCASAFPASEYLLAIENPDKQEDDSITIKDSDKLEDDPFAIEGLDTQEDDPLSMNINTQGISFVEIDDIGNKEYLYISRAIVENLSDDQLRAFSKEQIEDLEHRYTNYFSPHQLKVLQENGTANNFMEEAIYYQDQGANIFDDYPDDLSKHEIFKYVTCLTSEQLSSIREAQAMSLRFEDPLRLSPDQISHFPHFVKILNFSTYSFDRTYPNLKNSSGRRIELEQDKRDIEILQEYTLKFGSLKHIDLLTRDQVRGIPPKQIPEIPLLDFYILYTKNYDGYNRKYNKKEYEAPLTPEQFASMSSKQFDLIFKNTNWDEEVKYLSDEVLEALSLKRLDYLLEKIHNFVKYRHTSQVEEFNPIRNKLLKIRESLLQ